MEILEAYSWISVIRMAKNGNEDAQRDLQAENKVRKERGQLSVEEELMKWAEQQDAKR